MKKTTALLLLTLSLVTATAACGLLPPDELSGVLKVVVTDEDGQALADVPVAIWTPDNRKSGGNTGNDGVYTQQHLRKGSYRVDVSGQSESCVVRERQTTQCPFTVVTLVPVP